MQKYLLLLLSLFLIASAAIADDDSPKYACLNQYVGSNHPCNVGQPYTADLNAPTTIIPLPTKPSYFMRPSLVNDDVYVIGEQGNILVSAKDHKIVPLPGTIDPVPTPDGAFVSVPDGTMKFYQLGGDGVFKLVLSDESISANYQSIGILEKNLTKTRYRLIAQQYEDSSDFEEEGQSQTIPSAKTEPTYNNNLAFWEYESDTQNPGKLKKLSSGNLCTNLPGNYQLPRISHDGKMLGLLDSKENVTKIFEIQGSKCIEKYNLGIPTGKVDFSPDGTKITFHASSIYLNTSDSGQIFENPQVHLGMNVFVYSLKENTFTPVTNNIQGHSYYPGFKNNAEVVYLHTDRNESVPVKNLRVEKTLSTYSLRTATIANNRSIPAEILHQACIEENKSYFDIVALGKLWSQACLNIPIQLKSRRRDGKDLKAIATLGELSSATAAFFSALSLEPAECKILVEQCWAEVEKNKQEQNGKAFAWKLAIAGTVKINPDADADAVSSTRAVDLKYSDFSHLDSKEKRQDTLGEFTPNSVDTGTLGKQPAPPMDYSYLTKQDLLAACPAQSRGTTKLPIVYSSLKEYTPLAAYKKLHGTYCISCHGTASIPFSDLEKLRTGKANSGYTWREEILRRLNADSSAAGHMPPVNHPQPDESLRKQAVKYLKSLTAPATQGSAQ